MEKQWKLWDHCLNCEDIISTPILFYAPHCSRQEKVFHCTRKPQDTNTFKSHHKGYTATRQHMGESGAKDQLTHRGSHRNSETQKDAYSIPHPVPPKITPRARMVPATAPISLLVAMFTVWRENGECLTKEINYTLISLTYNITCSGNAFKFKYWDLCLNIWN